jgi:hypothetical protein
MKTCHTHQVEYTYYLANYVSLPAVVYLILTPLHTSFMGTVTVLIVLAGGDTMHNIISTSKAPYLAGMLLTGLLTKLTPFLLSLNLPSWLTFCCEDGGRIVI